MNESDLILMAIAIPLLLCVGVAIGYWLGRLDQRGWLAEQYKIACWQRDQAMSRCEQLVAMIELHRQNVEEILSESK